MIDMTRLSGLGLRPSGFRLRSSSYDGTRRSHTQGSTFQVEKTHKAHNDCKNNQDPNKL